MRNNFINDVAKQAIKTLAERLALPRPVIPQQTIQTRNQASYTIAGRTLPDAFALYRQIANEGILKNCYYCIEMEPYNPQSEMANSARIHLFKTLQNSFNHRWLLITNADWPILQADTESQKVASYQSNRITGRQAAEFALTFLDNKQADVLNSLQAIEGFIFNQDGTQNVPNDYAIRMTPYLFDAKSFKTRIYAKPVIVALQAVQTSTNAEHSPLEISTTWVQLDPFMG